MNGNKIKLNSSRCSTASTNNLTHSSSFIHSNCDFVRTQFMDIIRQGIMELYYWIKCGNKNMFWNGKKKPVFNAPADFSRIKWHTCQNTRWHIFWFWFCSFYSLSSRRCCCITGFSIFNDHKMSHRLKPIKVKWIDSKSQLKSMNNAQCSNTSTQLIRVTSPNKIQLQMH